MTDDEIMTGFASLHEAIALGFERLGAELAVVRTEAASFEQRVLRRFDGVDERFDAMESCLKRIERQ